MSYCSPHLARLAGVEQILIATDAGLSAFQPVRGEILWHHAWARNLALALLVIGSFFNARDFAWGFSGAKEARPTLRLYLVSGTVVAAWNAFWFYLIYRVAL